MNQSTETTTSTKFKVGIFTLLGLLLIGAMTVFVNDKPYWWRGCQLVHINVEDGTGLKSKSPIKSLGIEIGYLKTVELSETHVDLGICITAPVEVLPSTRAYLRGEGFLGDKFVELKPVKYVGPRSDVQAPHEEATPASATPSPSAAAMILDWLVPSAYAAPATKPVTEGAAPKRRADGREIPVGEQGQDIQHLVNRVDDLVNEMTNLTTNLKGAIDPNELRATMKQLNRTLENASRTLSPEGGLNQTAQRTLAKLEDAIEQLRDQMTRVNKGEGSVGMLLNDPQYADEIREAIRNVNRLLSKVGGVRFVVDMGGEQINAYNGGRGYFRLQIYPRPDRYYLLGISIDPRGKITQTTTTTVAGGQSTVTDSRQVESSGLLFTAMFGKIFLNRLEFALGALHGDGALSTALRLGPVNREEMFIVRNDVYARGVGLGIDDRLSLMVRPWAGAPHAWSALYVRAGIEGFKKVIGSGVTPYFYGAGVTFDDEDIKILFTLR
jgi:phospholipid/cholesterol/gamma-HCH transport system substrate-binding protein